MSRYTKSDTTATSQNCSQEHRKHIMVSDISEGGVGLDFAWKDGVSCSSDPIGGGGMMANIVQTDAKISK